jgi:hypothetical protein
VVVIPHWFVQGDAEGRWSVVMKLAIDTTRAENRVENPGHHHVDKTLEAAAS